MICISSSHLGVKDTDALRCSVKFGSKRFMPDVSPLSTVFWWRMPRLRCNLSATSVLSEEVLFLFFKEIKIENYFFFQKYFQNSPPTLLIFVRLFLWLVVVLLLLLRQRVGLWLRPVLPPAPMDIRTIELELWRLLVQQLALVWALVLWVAHPVHPMDIPHYYHHQPLQWSPSVPFSPWVCLCTKQMLRGNINSSVCWMFDSNI